jgi:methylated-DNA-protein-cysteine methyltransferase related protein
MDEELVERILRAAEQVPRGRVVSYGDLAELVGVGPRLVGRVMSLYGNNVAWWRVTSSYGDLPAHLRDEARARWADEGIAWKPNGLGCRITQHRADLERLADDYERTVRDLG